MFSLSKIGPWAAWLLASGVIGFAPPLATSQTTPPTWLATFAGPAQGDDLATAVAVMPSGNVAIAGMSHYEPTPGLLVPQFLTALYSQQGTLLWSRTHGSGFQSNGFAEKLAITPAGKIVTAGTRDNGGDWMVVQYDAAGNFEWEGVWLAGSTFVSSLADLDVDGAGNVYVCGDVSAGASAAKFSPTGALLWSRTYVSGTELTSVRGLAINAAGNVFLAGNSSTPAGALQFSVARIDPVNGAPTWIRKSGPTGASMFSLAQGLAVDGFGRAIAGGLLTDPTGTAMTLSFLAYSPDGTLSWQYDHGGPSAGFGFLEDIAANATGVVAAAGWTISPIGDIDGFVLRLNGGSFAWERSIAGSAQAEDRATGVALDGQGNVYAGAYVSELELGLEVWCYDPSGVQLGRGRAPAPATGSAFARDLAVGGMGRAYVVGDVSAQVGTFADALTAAFDFSGALPSEFCFGDASGAPCPCANYGAPGSGCASSSFGGGGVLSRSGNAGASPATDTLVLTATSIPGPGLFFQASGLLAGSGTAFGDGLLCAGVGIVRLGVVFPTASTASYPGGLTPLPIHVAGATAAGDVRHYQCWYRDAVAFCTPQTFNLTQGVTLTWGP